MTLSRRKKPQIGKFPQIKELDQTKIADLRFA